MCVESIQYTSTRSPLGKVRFPSLTLLNYNIDRENWASEIELIGKFGGLVKEICNVCSFVKINANDIYV